MTVAGPAAADEDLGHGPLNGTCAPAPQDGRETPNPTGQGSIGVPDDHGCAGSAPHYGNPDLWRYARWVPHIFVFAAELLVAAKLIPALPVTQYALAAFAMIMLIREVGELPSRSTPWQVVWPLGWSMIAVLGFSQPPAIGYAVSFTAFFWAFTVAEWRCAAEMRERIPGGLLRRMAAFKRIFGRGTRVAGATAIAGFAGVAGAFGTAVTIVHRDTTATEGTGPAETTPAKRPVVASTDRVASAQIDPPAHTEAPGPQSRLECPIHLYRNARWASPAINSLLGGGAGLGREEEGCVDSLSSRYASSDGFVFGRGLLGSGLVQSIVVDSETLGPPAIFIAPATVPIERLIRRYHVIGGAGKAFPRYRAGSGDYYLVNTLDDGTCVLIRERSGDADEAPAYTVLYPSMAVAWLRIVDLTGRWQWPSLLSEPNRRGEAVIELVADGETQGDAAITYNPRSLEARWNGDVFPARQPQLSPPELERFVRSDLGERPPQR